MTAQSSAGGKEPEPNILGSGEFDGALASGKDPVPQSDQDQDANSEAPSSNAEDETEATLRDVIEASIARAKPAEEPESSDRKDGQETQSSEDEAAKDGEIPVDAKPTDETDVPFHKHPRWQEMKRERDTYKASATQFDQIQTFMQVNGLAAEEVASGFEIMALMRGNPEAALQKLLPLVRDLELVTGKRLPDDLNQRVEDGVTDQETAQEAARLRIETKRNADWAQSQRETQAQTVQQAQVQSIQAAVVAVESELQSGDPDYARKQPFVMDRVRALISELRPQNPEDATAIVRRAHREVSDRLKPMVQRRQVTATTSGDTSTSAHPEPKTLLDVVRMAAAKSS